MNAQREDAEVLYRARMIDEEAGLALIHVRDLATFCDPVATPPWPGHDRPLEVDDLNGSTVCHLHQHAQRRPEHVVCVECDLSTVRWFAHDLDRVWASGPLHIDVGVFETPHWIVSDGNHRLAALILKNVPRVVVEFDGDIDLMRSMFLKTH